MDKTLFLKGENQRKSHNKNILRKMKQGEALATINTMMSWYPPRPVLKKNKHALRKLYGNLERPFSSSSFDLSSPSSKLLWFKKSS